MREKIIKIDNCYHCHHHDFTDEADKDGNDTGKLECAIMGRVVSDDCEIPDWCPLPDAPTTPDLTAADGEGE